MNLFLAVRPVVVNTRLMAIEHDIARTHLKSTQPKQAASVFTSSKYHKDSLVALEHTEHKCRFKQALDRKISLRQKQIDCLFAYIDRYNQAST
jgi:hypothetical protein